MFIILFIILFITVTPAFAQLSVPQTGQMGQQPLTYYRVGFVSKGKHLTKNEGEGLLVSLKDEPITEKYLIRLKPNIDGTYEIEMLVRIIFFDRKEAEKAVNMLKDMTPFYSTKFDLEVVQETQQ
jgi:hypothetical protein